MTGWIALGCFTLAVAGACALWAEVGLSKRKDLRTWKIGWVAWSMIAMSLIAAFQLVSGAPLSHVFIWSLVVGPLCYPIARIIGALAELSPYPSGSDETIALIVDEALESERLKYHATDFGDQTRASKVIVVERPWAMSALNLKISPTTTVTVKQSELSPLARFILRRSRNLSKGSGSSVMLAASFLTVVIVAAMTFPGLVRWIDYPEAQGAVAETLEASGRPNPHVKRDWLGTHCSLNQLAYRWSAMGSQGRACVSLSNGRVEVRVERRWPAQRF